MSRPPLSRNSASRRLQMKITEAEVNAINDWRYANRIPTLSEAIRRLCRIAREEAAAECARQEEQRKAREAIEAAEAEARAVKEKAEREERERQEALERTRREEESRAADREHRSNVMSAAKTAIMTCGADEDTAKKIVLAIVAGEIPHTALRF